MALLLVVVLVLVPHAPLRWQVALLALFSSPSRWKSGRRIPQLQLMKEIMALVDAVPRHMREIRPAARFRDDVHGFIQELSPRVLQAGVT